MAAVILKLFPFLYIEVSNQQSNTMAFAFHPVRRHLLDLRCFHNGGNVRNEQIQVCVYPNSFYVA